MSLVNDFYSKPPNRAEIRILLTLLSPFAPHIAEELWELQEFDRYALEQEWPEYDEDKTLESNIEMAVQVMGKLRGTIIVPIDSEEEFVVKAAKSDEKIAKNIEGKEIIRTIVVKNKLVNLIIR